MKRLFYNSIILLILCAVLLFFTSCNESKTESDNSLKYYTYNLEDDFITLIRQYNKMCAEKYDESYQIEIIEFKNKDDMCTKMSTEIMAGNGPDIISLDQKLPFEKLIENEAFLDINNLIDKDESKDKINMDEYNSVIMNVGMYGDKRYIIPLTYGIDVLVSTQERLGQFKISKNNGEILTYSNISVDFSPFFSSETNYNFVSNDSDTDLWFDHPMQLFGRFINDYVDLKNKATSFSSDEFNSNLDIMSEIVKISKENTSEALFDDLYINRSLPLITGKYGYYKSIGETPIILRGLVKSDDVYSAFAEIGFAINKNTKFREQAYEFIKYVLSDDCQLKICGAKGNSLLSDISFPVNKKAYEQLKYKAGRVTDDNDKIVGIDNDFINTYMEINEKINRCTLYRDVSHSYYNSSVIGDIVDKYLKGDISKDKFIRQLSAATEIYLTE